MLSILQVPNHLCLEFMEGQIILNIFPILLQLVFHRVYQNMGLGIDIVYVRIQNTTIPMQHVYPNIYVGWGWGGGVLDSKLNHM